MPPKKKAMEIDRVKSGTDIYKDYFDISFMWTFLMFSILRRDKVLSITGTGSGEKNVYLPMMICDATRVLRNNQ
ncbi:MAG: hypothetical protein PVH87_11850 [Desulfobacteraceae bacterium]